MKFNVDFETRSTVDLRKTGVYPYALNPQTDVWCLAYSVDGAEPELWIPGQPVPEVIADCARDAEWHAWNAQFERVIWTLLLAPRYGFPRLQLEQWYDTAAAAAAMALPRALEDAARVLGIPAQKDKEGKALMQRMARPRKKDPLTWWDEPARMQRLYEYCKQDVRVEAQIGELVRPLGASERRVYLLDQRINDRGVRLDLELVRAAQRIAKEGVNRANGELAEITSGDLTKVTKAADLTNYLQEAGIETDNVRKDTVRDLLADGVVDDTTRRVLELRSQAAKSSTAKLQSMLDAACWDGRARGLLLYHGASTGRWAGRLVQPQNMPRPEVEDVERFIPAVLSGDYETIAAEAPPLIVVSSLLRSMITAAPGHRLIAGDYSQIEARVVAWIAEQEDLVQLFAAGGKIYEEMAASIYNVPVASIGKDSKERQVGKATVLGAGFGMGWKTFVKNTHKQTGILLPDAEAETAIQSYRNRFSRIRQFWWDIDQAAIRAVKLPGQVTRVGRNDSIKFLSTGRFLWCVLPSGRPLCYATPSVVMRMTPWGEEREAVQFFAVSSYTRKWGPVYGYGGLWTENVVQAIARDLAASAMERLEEAGYRPILSVHDEVLSETPIGHGSVEEYLDIMRDSPDWANGLPVAAEGWEGNRYRK